MNFGQAIEALKHGEKVQRKIWNARGMLAEDWDIYTPPKTIEQLAKENIEFCERELNKRGYELIR